MPTQRALARRDGLRFFAIVLWSGFLGAACMLLAWLAFLDGFPAAGADLGHLSRVFLFSWATALVPSICAALLATPHRRAPHGH